MDEHLDTHLNGNVDMDPFCWCTGIFIGHLSMWQDNISLISLHLISTQTCCPASIPIRVQWAASVYMLGPYRSETAVLKVTHEGRFLRVSRTMMNTAVGSALLEFLTVSLCWCCRAFLFPFSPSIHLSCLLFHPSSHSHTFPLVKLSWVHLGQWPCKS